jgi:hypothetical protein
MKKIIIVSATAAVAMFGAVGVAYADGSHHHHGRGANSTNCTSDDNIHQSNKGHQFVGGNLGAQDVAGNVFGVQSTRPAGICPSIGNNNHL